MKPVVNLAQSTPLLLDAFVRQPRYWLRRWRDCQVVRHFGVLLDRRALESEAMWELVLRGRYERGEARCLLMGLEAGDVVLEIGAGIGFISTLAAKVVGAGNVHCYEANPALVERIQQTHVLNGLAPSVANAVLGDGTSEVEFHVRPNFTKSSLTPGPDVVRTVRVPLLDVNEEIARTGATCVVMDVEGAEEELVRAIDWAPVCKLVLELHPHVLGGERTRAIVRDLEARGLVTKRFASTSNKRLMTRS